MIGSIYNPPRERHSVHLKEFYKGDCRISYYSLARHALKEGLISLGLHKNSTILLPEFICGDVLAPFNELQMQILFFEVDEKLNPVLDLKALPKADAIFAIHYFGLETKLDFFYEYCCLNGALLIEDNAHGLFSRNSNGLLLGTQGDIGIISVRKSLPIVNGAMLIQKNIYKSPPDLEIVSVDSFRLLIKNLMRPLVAKFGISFLLFLTKLKRVARRLVKGAEIPVSGQEDEQGIPMLPNPIDIDRYFLTVNIVGEVDRRRKLFEIVASLLKNESIRSLVRPLREKLSANEVPYVFPFYCLPVNLVEVKKYLESYGFEIVNWPALPTCLLEKGVPEFYLNLYLVKFLW